LARGTSAAILRRRRIGRVEFGDADAHRQSMAIIARTGVLAVRSEAFGEPRAFGVALERWRRTSPP
jgi:hypothetical protein